MKNKKQHTGFKTPETYFLDLEEKLLPKLEEETIPTKNGFKTPDGYFDTLENKLLTHITLEGKKSKVISIFSKKSLWYAASIAASFTLLFSIFYNQKKSLNFQDLEIASIENYIEEENISLEALEFATLTKDIKLENSFFEDELFSEEDIENYLIKNTEDLELFSE